MKIVKYTDIHKAIVKRIKTKFPSTVFSTDIEKKITRPSFFIDFDNIKASDFMSEALDRDITVRIYYFSTTVDENKIELLNMEDNLIEMFLENNLINVDKYVNIEIQELDLKVVDKVLHCYFDVSMSENYQRDKSSIGVGDKEMMEKLEVDNILKE